jgi:hypothetical protein
VGHVEQPHEADTIDMLVDALEASDYDMRAAIEALATSESFRLVGVPTEDGP